jgi:ATP-binding cassette subfamily C protein
MNRILGLGKVEGRSALTAALESCRRAVLIAILFSAVVNLSMLAGSIYMLQVYDRVLPSRSTATLLGLTILLVAVFALQGVMDVLRGRLMARIGARFEEQLAGRVYDMSRVMPVMGARPEQAVQPMRDLDQVRAWLSGAGPTAMFDLPFMALFIGICFLLHPLIGFVVCVGGVVIFGLTLYGETRGRDGAQAQGQSAVKRQLFLDSTRRDAEVIQAMGLGKVFRQRFLALDRACVADQLAATESTGAISVSAKVFRLFLQSALLGLGAWLALKGDMTPGSMIACSILAARALAPVEMAVQHWKPMLAAEKAFGRLHEQIQSLGEPTERMELPAPKAMLSARNLAVAPPNVKSPTVMGVDLELEAGQGVCIIGPSGCGKSTLLRTLVGVWRPLRGEVAIDGVALAQWNDGQIGRAIGYLPQDVELFDGTIGENISRFQPDATPDDIHAAAKAAGAYGLVTLLGGFDTRVGEGGASLSAGQRQRIGLARALFGNPFIVVLDEPNSNLDQDGDEALTEAIRSVRARGGIVLVVTHRASSFQAIDLVAVVGEGRLKAFGPRDEVLPKFLRKPPGQTGPVPVRVAS